jgi:VWFA-related protein
MRNRPLAIFQRGWLVTTACALLGGPVGHAQAPSGGQQSGAIFRASVQLVQVDVAVSDAQGVAVPTLGPSDFMLRQDGKPVPVQFATFVTGAMRQTRFVFFIDDYHLEFDNFARVREAVSRFMEQAAPAGAEMLVMPASFVGEKTFAFTTSPTVVRRQIADLSWGKGKMPRAGRRGTPTCENLTNDLRADMVTAGTMGTLTALLAALHQIDGRKAVILLTDGLISACRADFDAPERLRRISEIANRGSSVLYGVDTRSFTSAGSNMLDDDLQYLAERTGGLSGRSNAIEKILARVAADQEGYYLLAYEPPPATFKRGRLQYRDVKVTVTRPDLQVRARAGFYSVPDGALKLQ